MTDGTDAAAAARARLLRLLVVACAVGLLAAGFGVLFTAVDHQLQHLLWESLPERLGAAEPPSWLVVALLLTGALLVALTLRLPGAGGHSPLDGIAMNTVPGVLASVLLASLASLSFGAVLGPEAPLLAIGTSIAVAVARSSDPEDREILMFAGAVAGMGTIFGNPLITGILALEALLLGGKVTSAQAAMMRLLPILLALGSGYLLDVGVGSWSGFAGSDLSVPGLPAYGTVAPIDLAVALPVAVVSAVVVLAARRLAAVVRGPADRNRVPALLAGGLAVALAALMVRTVTGEPVDLVLFSGQASIPELLGVASLGTVVLVVLAKAFAYGLSLSVGFRGGAIFPAVYLGVGVAVAAHLGVSDTNLSALTAAGIAAACAAAIRLPFTSVLLGVLLCISAGSAVTVTAIVGAVLGLLAALAQPESRAVEQPQAEGNPTPATDPPR